MRRWGYIDNTQSVNCDCGEPQTMANLLDCRLLDEPYSTRRPHHRHRKGKCVCPDVTTQCVKDTREEAMMSILLEFVLTQMPFCNPRRERRVVCCIRNTSLFYFGFYGMDVICRCVLTYLGHWLLLEHRPCMSCFPFHVIVTFEL